MPFFQPLLTLDAAGSTLTLELGESKTPIYHRREVHGGKLQEHLLRAIDGFIRDVGIDLGDVGALAVNQGPGNYSRLRVSLTWAKTTAFYLQIPLIGYDIFSILDHYLKSLCISMNSSDTGNQWHQKFKDGLSEDLQKKLLSFQSALQSPLKVYLYRVSSNRFFACPYWNGQRVGGVMALSSLPSFSPSTFDENIYFLLGGSDLKSDRNQPTVKSECQKWVETYISKNQSLESKEQNKSIVFLFDGSGDDHDFDEIPPSSSILLVNPLEKELGTLQTNGENRFPKISIYHCAMETLKEHSPEEFINGFLEVNPQYYREFGE